MLFNSFEFIFIFAPIVLMGYFLIAKLIPNYIYNIIFLAIVSLIFYAYWNINFIPIIISSIFINYLFGLMIDHQVFEKKLRKIIFIIAITYNLIQLAYFKYMNFGIDIVNEVFSWKISEQNILLPLGISFFTFTQIAYLIDILKGHPKEKNFFKYALFVTYFPHLVAGPILHHKEMMPQFNYHKKNTISLDKIILGLTIFSIGLFKKVVIADGCSIIANPIFSALSEKTVFAFDAIAAAIAYTLQIYFDFSGYSDMAIGLSLMLGIKLPFNFNAPYKSCSIIEFWQRWHISLSRFLRDYLYIPIGGNRRGPLRRYINLFITMLLGGLWHGAGWTYLIWGLLHGFYLTTNHAWRALLKIETKNSILSSSIIYKIISFLTTQICVIIAWIYFRADSLTIANNMIKAMFTFHHGSTTSILPSTITNIDFIFIILIYLFCIICPNLNLIFDKYNIGLKIYNKYNSWSLLTFEYKMNIFWSLITSILFIISLFFILIVGDGTEFLYFQF